MHLSGKHISKKLLLEKYVTNIKYVIYMRDFGTREPLIVIYDQAFRFYLVDSQGRFRGLFLGGNAISFYPITPLPHNLSKHNLIFESVLASRKTQN